MNTNKAIALIHTQFGPYHLARVKVLQAIYPGSVKLIQLAERELQREWTVEGEMPEIFTVAGGALETLNPQVIADKLIEHLATIKPAVVVIAGYNYLAMRKATKWAKQNGVKTVLLSDSQYLDQPRNLIKEALKGWWIRNNFDAAFVAGASAAFYLEHLGFRRDRLWRCYDVVENQYFASHAEQVRQFPEPNRQKYNLPEHFFLYVGRFSAEKNLSRLLEAYHRYQQHHPNGWSLVMVGSGPQQTELKDTVTRLGIKNLVWTGFKQLSELPIYYGLASALILPSLSEPWGLVVNEAMACSLPILISDRCGCLLDLVFPGINGYVFNPLEVTSIEAGLNYFSSQPSAKLSQMSAASRQIIANYTPQTWAEALVDCVKILISN
ncbi:MAG: glycosyltransferase family 4 protein [Pleurocapsa sp. MO_226.B13]|nr:glycosyltransferase family 4 protein [Pleurocapsa sp. MO_226.B13]